MSFELWTTVGTVGTFFVLAATGLAALIQLRHMRGGNQISALTEVRETMESAQFVAARRFILKELPELLNDPPAAARLRETPLDEEFQQITFIANFFETMGAFVKHGVIDKEMACDMWGYVVEQSWDRLEPVVAIRRAVTDNTIWENFEYLSVLAQDWTTRHPDGAYPKGMRRRKIRDGRLPADMATATA